MIFIRAAFTFFKDIVQSGKGGLGKAMTSGGQASRLSLALGGDAPSDIGDQIKKLKMQVQQRDNEINILVSMLQRRDSGKGASGRPAVSALQVSSSPGGGATRGLIGPSSVEQGGPIDGSSLLHPEASAARPEPPGRLNPSSSWSGTAGMVTSVDDITTLMNTNLLGDRNKAFELFRKSYRQNEVRVYSSIIGLHMDLRSEHVYVVLHAPTFSKLNLLCCIQVIEENKLLLKQKYDSAKGVGQSVNDSKQRITELKALIEQRRVQRAMTGQYDTEGDDSDDPEEARFKVLIEEEKRRYKDSFNSLRDLKKEIEHLHLLLEQSRARLQKDFDQWMNLMTRQREQQQQQAEGPSGASIPLSGSIAVPASPQRSASLTRYQIHSSVPLRRTA